MTEEYLRVHTLPRNVRAEDLAASTVVVVDVLRAIRWCWEANAKVCGLRDLILGTRRRSILRTS
jgi:hypothetical protein